MKIKRYRNYWLSFIMCMVCTVLTMINDPSWEKIKLYLISDVNVSMWLWVAWLFDDTNAA